MSQNQEGQRYFFLKRNLVTVEPVAFFALFSATLSSTASKSISIDKVCRVKLKIDDDICYSIRSLSHPNDEYGRMVYDYFLLHGLWENVVACLLPCILLLFIGGWSDRTGHRKLILLLPVIGRSLEVINSFINAVLYHQIPLEFHMFFNAFFVNIFGGLSLMLFALFTYVVVTSSVKYRIYRITSISVCATTGVMLGKSLCKVILEHFNYYPILILSFIMNAMTSVYIIYKVSDPKRNAEEMMYDEQTVLEFIKNFFNVAYIRETAEVIGKKTSSNRELLLCFHVLSLTIIIAGFVGEFPIFELIARYDYGWNDVTLQFYRMYSLTISTVGLLITVGVITKWLQCHDSVVGIASSISKIISSLVFCFVEKYIFFVGPIAGIIDGPSYLAMFSLTSKLLDNKEVGKINALVFLLANLVRLVYVPLYIFVYVTTRHLLPGAVYLMRAGYTLPIVGVFIWLLIKHRRESAT